MAQADYFLKIDGVDGGATDAHHQGAMEVETWSLGGSNPTVTSGSGERHQGRVSLQDFKFTKRADKSSPRLFTACCAGERFRSATLIRRNAGMAQQEFLTVVLTDVMVTSFQTRSGVDSDVTPLDEITLGYARIEYRYKEQSPDGSTGDEISGGWDVATNSVV
jgi:type VI secretion system secreted protein Hcp